MIYLDPSALAKLVVEETESAALAAWLDERPEEVLATSALTKVELVRAATRRSPETRPAALALLAEMALVPTDATVIDNAWSLEPASLPSLDAVHLASALTVGTEVTLVAYDPRLLEEAAGLGLRTAAPR